MKDITLFIKEGYHYVELWDYTRVNLTKEKTQDLKNEADILSRLIQQGPPSDPGDNFMIKDIYKTYPRVLKATLKELQRRGEDVSKYMKTAGLTESAHRTTTWDDAEVDLEDIPTAKLKSELGTLCHLIKTMKPTNSMGKDIVASYREVAKDTIDELESRGESVDSIISKYGMKMSDF